jgi:hypothetical protein
MGVYTLNIVGESYRQKAIKHCREGDQINLRREPKNKYDSNAVAVLRKSGEQIGYLSREDAEWVARIMDAGDTVEARIKWLTGGTRDKPTYGVVIDINTTPDNGWEENKGEEKSRKGFWKRLLGI